MLKVGLIGFGYWGPNLLRNFKAHSGFEAVVVADSSPEKRELLKRHHPDLTVVESGDDLINFDVDVVAIATPVNTHFRLAKMALEAGKHVIVEKPLTASFLEAKALVEIAEAKGLTLMVDHTFLFTGAVQYISDLVVKGGLGKISYYDSMRINLGLFQPDVNVLWDLAPHDFSIMDFLLKEEPIYVEASGFCHVNAGVPDVAYLTLHFQSSMVAHFNLSWMSPVKMRRIGIGGSERMLVWDDLNREEKLKIYDAGIRMQPNADREIIVPDYRIGDIHSPRVPNTEALASVVGHLHDVISGRATPIMSGRDGMRNVWMLEQAQKALDRSFAAIASAAPDQRVAAR